MLRIASLLPLFALLARAAEEEAAHAEPSIVYKWINFGILAVALIYLFVKFLIPVLKARSSSIEKDLAESKANVVAADAKVAALSAKLGNFDAEIQSIRDRSLAERDSEGNRISGETLNMLAKVSALRETEIGHLTNVAQFQLRSFAATKAIEIAQARLAANTDEATHSSLVQAFIEDMKQQEAR